MFFLYLGKLAANDELKNLIENQIKNVQYAKLSADERQRFAKVSMDTLKKMALGEIQGYDVRPAVAAVKTQVRSPAFSLDAIETLGR